MKAVVMFIDWSVLDSWRPPRALSRSFWIKLIKKIARNTTRTCGSFVKSFSTSRLPANVLMRLANVLSVLSAARMTSSYEVLPSVQHHRLDSVGAMNQRRCAVAHMKRELGYCKPVSSAASESTSATPYKACDTTIACNARWQATINGSSTDAVSHKRSRISTATLRAHHCRDRLLRMPVVWGSLWSRRRVGARMQTLFD
ncbi:hypothetical protein EJ03DRAFT_204717 [Teratosphaeria nubilosa]|uniref:Uncharacterized protein n=1 Tax=Teratosphaeria nubilosa TaxID=161662 RepID=A0A6G1KYX1_9PEZI|nr:hypothetical protein EJ03DRAFT_204717 [Teratosphaeria nubilosa]